MLLVDQSLCVLYLQIFIQIRLKLKLKVEVELLISYLRSYLGTENKEGQEQLERQTFCISYKDKSYVLGCKNALV